MTAPVIRTERLTLRPHVMADWESMATFFKSDAARFVGGPVGRRRAWYWFAGSVGSWDLLGFGGWAVDETGTGDFVGQIALTRAPHFPEAEIGWIVFPAFQRRGFAAEAAGAARRFAYRELGWKTAVSYIDPDNAASIATARRLGCVEDRHAERIYDQDLVFRHPAPERRG